MKSNAPPTIWIFNHYALPPSESGGTRHFDLSRELVKRGYKVTIFASSFSHREYREMKEYDRTSWLTETIEGVDFVWIRTAPYSANGRRRLVNMLEFAKRSYSAAKALAADDRDPKKPDIVIGSSVHLFAVEAALRTARHFKARFLMEVRDVWPRTLVDLGVIGPRHPLVLILRRLELRLYREAEKMITPLAGAESYFVEHGFAPENILYLPQAAPDEAFSGPVRKRRPRDPFVAAYAGSFGPADNVGHLIKAARLLDPAKFHFRFAGAGEEHARLKELARAEGMTHVEWLGPLPKSEVPSFLARADICLAHYYDAGARIRFGVGSNKLVSYLAAGCPVVFAGNFPGDIVAESGAGLTVGPEDPKLMAEAIEQLSSLPPAELAEMGARGKSFARELHSVGALVDKLEVFLARC